LEGTLDATAEERNRRTVRRSLVGKLLQDDHYA